MNFIGREQEQKVINHILNNEGFQSCIIYGRRRLGKTELIKHCVINRKEKYIIYQCKEANEFENTSLLTRLIQDTFNIPFISFSTFIDALSYLFEYSKKENIILVIDEYPYIREIIEGCDSKLQELIDTYSNESNLKLFLLGSSINTMEDILTNHSPLYGRFNQAILLKQMDYYDSSKFYDSFSNEDKVKLYSVFGGVPYYNKQISKNESVEENIIRLISGSFSGLRDFLDTYLKAELRKVNNANIVFDVIAKGAFHYSDILSKSHIESSPILNFVLQKLIKMDLIEYVCPINYKNNKQKAGYRINDNSLRFYYNFIYKNDSALQILDDKAFYDHYIKDELDSSYVPKMFETICKEYLIRLNRKGLFTPTLIDIGTYWYDNPIIKKNGQFDIVGKCPEGYIFFECKYTNSKIDSKVIEEEIVQVNNTNLKPFKYGFFAKNGYDINKDNDYYLFSLEDLYK